MEASGSTRRVHGYFENPINLVFSPPPPLPPPLSLSTHTTSSDRAMKFPRRPNLSLFPGHSGYTIRYPRAFLSSTSPLHTLPSESKPRLSSSLFPSSIPPIHLPCFCPRLFLGFDAGFVDRRRRDPPLLPDTGSNAPPQLAGNGRSRFRAMMTDDSFPDS